MKTLLLLFAACVLLAGCSTMEGVMQKEPQVATVEKDTYCVYEALSNFLVVQQPRFAIPLNWMHKWDRPKKEGLIYAMDQDNVRYVFVIRDSGESTIVEKRSGWKSGVPAVEDGWSTVDYSHCPDK